MTSSTELNWALMMDSGWCQQPQSCIQRRLTFNNHTIKAFKPNVSAKLESESLAEYSSANTTDKDNSVIFLPHYAERRAGIWKGRQFDLTKADWKDLVSVEPLGVWAAINEYVLWNAWK